MIHTVLSVLYILLHVILFLIRRSPRLNITEQDDVSWQYCTHAILRSCTPIIKIWAKRKTRRFMSVGWSFSFDLNRQIILLFHHHDPIDVTHVHAPSRVSILIIAIISTLLLTIFPFDFIEITIHIGVVFLKKLLNPLILEISIEGWRYISF